MGSSVFLMIIPLLLGVILHEVAHGYIAYILGDPTAKNMGRLTLNPLPHIDPIGSILIPAALVILRIPFIFGYAKPVPINPFNLKNPRKDFAWIAIAGPTTNFLLAIAFALLYRIFNMFSGSFVIGFKGMCFFGVEINLILAFFNLIPIPPLDGGRIINAILPHELSYKFSRIEPYGMYIVIALIFLGLFNFIYSFFIIPMMNLLLM